MDIAFAIMIVLAALAHAPEVAPANAGIRLGP